MCRRHTYLTAAQPVLIVCVCARVQLYQVVRQFGWCLGAESWRLVIGVTNQLLVMDALPASVMALHDFVGWQPAVAGRAGALSFAPELKADAPDAGVTSLFSKVSSFFAGPQPTAEYDTHHAPHHILRSVLSLLTPALALTRSHSILRSAPTRSQRQLRLEQRVREYVCPYRAHYWFTRMC